MSAFTRERVTAVRHWTERLFSLRTTRPVSLRFRPGEFTMLGLEVEGKPLLRAYSIASAAHDPELGFVSIKVPDGPLTRHLQSLREGSSVLVGRKPTGTLVIDDLRPGRVLFLLATGTGVAPFLSILRDPETWGRFGRVVLVHGCRRVAELGCAEDVLAALPADPLVGEVARERFVYRATVTREPWPSRDRITALLASGALDEHADGADDAERRYMLCGAPGMVADCRRILRERGLAEGNHGEAGDFVVEKAFVER